MLQQPGPVGALARHAVTTPERPFLFFVRGLDWRWLSFAEVAARVGGLAAWLDHLPKRARTGFPATAGVSSWLLDLAIRATDRIAVPIGPFGSESERDPELVRLDAQAFLAPPGFASSQTTPTVELPDPLTLAGALPGGEGGVLIEEGGASIVRPRVFTLAELAAVGERFESAIERRARRPPREIVVVGPPSRCTIDRAFSDWALRSGAACLFEPDPSARAASAAWGRVTVHAGSAAELAELLGRSRKAQRVPFSRSQLPFDRLHTVFPADPGLDPEAVSAWRALGVAVG